ncbi:hypothetical protein [Streptomyces sp. NBC_00306]|uniref:hypothetical protein n=1 Tax=Streptomyces sp. NBC_00306 TaxID=2975708 RepID=UPI002E2A6E76|nr:hypothetical protein [Streptomyces sp. NBC_00306]
MNSILSAPRTSRTWTATVAVLLAAAALTAPATASATPHTTTVAANSSRLALSCKAATRTGHPISFSPALTLQQRKTRITATVHLTKCSGANQQLRSGTFKVQGTAQASCSGALGVSGSGSITWYDAKGHRAGTSTVRPTGSATGYNPGNALLGGTVTSGPLNRGRITGSATPTSDVSRCAVTGLRTLSAAGTLKFQR